MYGKAVFEGGLNFMTLADLFQILGGNGCTGVLRLTSPYAPASGFVYFKGGHPINATCGPLCGSEAVYALFGWTDGEYEFYEGPVEMPQTVRQSRMEIVLDALRMLDDGLIEQVGPDPKGRGAEKGRGGPLYGEASSTPFVKGPLVDYMYIIDEHKFRDGERIIAEGGYGKWIWVVLEGAVEISRDTPVGPLRLVRLGEGSFVGTFTSFIFREYVRSATVRARGDVHLGLLDTMRLSAEYGELSWGFRTLLLSLANRLRKVSDRAVDFSANGGGSGEGIDSGDVLIEQGSRREELFTIAEGRSYVIGHTSKGPLPLVTLEKEDVFGYLPFMDIGHEPRAASVLASRDLRLERIDTDSLRREYDRLTSTFRNLIDNVSACISVTTKMAVDLGSGIAHKGEGRLLN